MNKKLTLTALFILMLITLSATGVYANYQSIGSGVMGDYNATEWIIGVRQMEEAGQVMGLNETINTETAESASDTSNNIDVHMMKNTEYGAIVILGASEYGKQGTGEERYMNLGATTTSGTDVKATTTGNVYGLYEIGYSDMDVTGTVYEWTAAGASEFLPNIAPRYINRYTLEESSARVGDATVETAEWHGSTYANWLSSETYGFRRGRGGAFTYRYASYASNSYACRASVVVGSRTLMWVFIIFVRAERVTCTSHTLRRMT